MTPKEIKKARYHGHYNNLTQTEFAILLNVHPITISKWERGITKPTVYQAELIKIIRTVISYGGIYISDIKGWLHEVGPIKALYFILQAYYENEKENAG